MPPRETHPDNKVARRIEVCAQSLFPRLNLAGLDLEKLPERVRNLSWLRELSLASNWLNFLPDWICELRDLRVLELQDNPLDTVPESMQRLVNLEVLRIDRCSANVAHALPRSLQDVRQLGMNGLGLTRVPDSLRALRNLQSLDLGNNALTELPDWMGELQQLSRLDVASNRLRVLPHSLQRLATLRSLAIDGNPNLALPPEIAAGRDARKVLDYYSRTVGPDGAEPLNEFKLVLVGRGGVGKTSLVHRLTSDRFRRFKRTPGIKIRPWQVATGEGSLRAHIWDFGGQEILHGTHRFFMTERALYLVLVSGREGTEDRDAEYWLSLVRSFAGDAPVIVLLSKWADYRFEVNRELIREKYGRDVGFLEIDSETGKNIAELRARIAELALTLPGLRAAWPIAWRGVKQELPATQKSWLSFTEFRAFCRARGLVDQRDQDVLAESLHDLGIMLSYREEALRGIGVLNPEWVTQGIYAILDSQAIRDAGGKFTLDDCTHVLPPSEYPPELYPYLLALMRKFRLCHPLDDRGHRYLIPELLTKTEPRLDEDFPPDKCLNFLYRYESVLPEGLLPRFIVETYVHREPQRVWRTGVVLERGNARALVRGDVQGRTITVRVMGSGTARRELLGIVREHLERIHRSFAKLPVTELVPIPQHPEAHVRYESLLRYERAGREHIAVEVNDRVLDASVGVLLDGIDGRRKRLHGDQSGYERRVPVFISYSHKDSILLDQLRGALVPHERAGELEVWADPLIEPGQEWEAEITQRLGRARIIILLLSNDFFRSSFCIERELTNAMERHDRGECEILPVVVRACRYDKHAIGRLQVIRPNDRPIDEHVKQDDAWLKVTQEVDRVLERIYETRSYAPTKL